MTASGSNFCYADRVAPVQLAAGLESVTLHRDVVAAADVVAAPANPTLADRSADSGSLTANTSYKVALVAGNRWGVTTTNPAVQSTTTANDANNAHVIRVTFSQVAGADYYDVFLSTDAAPKWVARVTEAQRASGIIVSAVGTLIAGGTAGAVDVRVVGTGQQTTAANFLTNNAYRPDNVTPVDCTGHSKARLHIKVSLTDLRSAPALTIVPFFRDPTSTSDWFQGQPQTLSLLADSGTALEQDFEINVDGCSAFSVLVDAISGQGASCSIWVNLV